MRTVPEALPRRPGDASGHLKRYREVRGMRAATRSATQKAGCEGPSNIYYLCYLLLPIITYYWLLLPRAIYWSIMIENDNTRRDQIDICNMAHETNKAMSDQSNTLWLAGGEGDQGSTTFFYRHFSSWWSGASVFILAPHLQSHTCALLKCAFQDNARYTKVADFLHNHWDSIPSTLAAPVDISGRL